MSVKQLSTFLENSPGAVAEITKILAKSNINISALVLSDTIDFGVLRLIVSDTEKAYKILKENKFIVRQSDVLIVPISQDIGSLDKVLEALKNDCISIEYMYAFSGKEYGKAFAVLKMDDLEGAKKVLEKSDIHTLCGNELK